MQPLEKRWEVAPPPPPAVDRALCDYPPLVRRLLYARGFQTPEDARRFLDVVPPFETSPFGLKGMDAAADRLAAAVRNGEAIAVYGDYDADGVTATALLMRVLQKLGADARPYIPNRFDEGYGLNFEALDGLADAGVDVVVTVDCGIRSVAEVAHAQSRGLDVILTDHHHPGAEIPPAFAVINPKQPGDTYPEKNLAGVGLAYKLALALLEQLGHDPSRAASLLDLVALGTVADLAPLTGENRALVRAGLEQIRRARRQGVFSLIRVAGLQARRITAMNIGFALGPRLNAAGRLESALAAYALLVTDDVFEAGRLAQQLDQQNRLRQTITREIQERAEQMAVDSETLPYLLFAADPDFNAGVVGLAASRLVERYYRPAIVGQRDAEYTRASCRSIPEFHITQALDQCADLLDHHGGHAAAAGFTVRTERLPELIDRLQAIAEESLAKEDLRPVLRADAEVHLADLTPDLLAWQDRLEPTGYGNPQPQYVARGVQVRSARPVGRDGTHLKLTLAEGRLVFDAIAFRQGHWAGRLPEVVDVLFTFEVNEWNGRETLQLNVKDIKPAA